MTYTSADIDEWDDVTHTRFKPNVNLGEYVYDTALREVTDNAVEEVANPANGGSHVGVVLHADGSVTVTDDGRGLPVDTDPKTRKNGIVKTLGSARAGSKFRKTDAEATGAGTNGIGAAAAVFVSRRADVTVKRGGKTYAQQFKDGYPGVFAGTEFDPDAEFTRNDTLVLKGVRNKEQGAHGTSVRILFDYSLWDAPLSINEVLIRVHAAVRMSSPVTLTVTDEGFPDPVRPELVGEFTGPYGTAALLPFMSEITGSDPATGECANVTGRGTYTRGAGRDAAAASVPFTWSLTAGPVAVGAKGAAHGFCNTVRTANGGTHVNAAVKAVAEAMADKVSRLRGLPLNKGESAPEAADFAEVTAMALDLRTPNVAWDSQSKTKVTARALSAPMEADVRRAMAVWTANPANAPAVLTWAKTALEAARTRRAVDTARQRSRAAAATRGLGANMALPDKLLPCRETGRGSGSELLLCEGDSAKQTIKSARNPDIQAVYPMRGKTLNPWEKTLADTRKNAEFADVEAILGCGAASSVDVEKCRYDRIIFTADADPDGKGINSQLAMIFARFFRPLIKAGMVFVAVPPLFVVEWAGLRLYCVTAEDKDDLLVALRAATGSPNAGDTAMTARQAREAVVSLAPPERRDTVTAILDRKNPPTKIKVNRCKGLGEMSSDDFYATVLNPATRNLIQLTIPDDEALDRLGDTLFMNRNVEARKAWMQHPHAAEDIASSTAADAVLAHVAADVTVMPVTEFWNHDYLEYAKYTVSDRAVPFSDSGLKPGQQRILYASLVMGATPTGDAPKTQKLASTTAGELHPHGDAAIAETIALMAADYQRAKLIDGQGAFPTSVGDDAASPRYTHARLSPAGYELVRDLKDGPVVDIVPTYDETGNEPVTLPSRFPALLVYGCPTGIAVGWASQVPAHNPREVIAATRALLSNPKLTDDELCALLPCPDWGSGGAVVGTAGIRDYILTGNGVMTVCGAYEVDGKDITITELPPGVALYTAPVGKKPAGGLQGSIRQAVLDGKITGVSDVANLSGRGRPVALRITCKRGVNPEDVMEQVRANTPFETSFGAQLAALDSDKTPRIWTVRELLERFLSLRDSVVTRRSRHRRDKAATRQHLVRGLVAVLASVTETVEIIQGCDTDEQAVQRLGERFGIDATQAEHVLGMQLRRLKGLDRLALEREDETLTKEIAALDKLLSSPAARRKVIDAELSETAKLFDGAEFDRRTRHLVDAVPVSRRNSPSESDGERTVNPNWRIDETGVFSSERGELLSGALAWAVFTDGRVKLTDGKGLPQRIRDTPIAPDIGKLLTAGVLKTGQDLLLVTRGGKALRLMTDKIPVHGVSSNGVAGAKLVDDGDAVVAAFPVTDASAVLTISDKAYKATVVSDIPSKGRGSQGVGIHTLVTGEEGVFEAHVSDTGFVLGGKRMTLSKRPKATTKGSCAGWERG